MSDLEFVTTDELIEELRRRYDNLIFCGSKAMTDSLDATDVFWHGCLMHCSGLCQWGVYRLQEEYSGRGRRVDDSTDIESGD